MEVGIGILASIVTGIAIASMTDMMIAIGTQAAVMSHRTTTAHQIHAIRVMIPAATLDIDIRARPESTSRRDTTLEMTSTVVAITIQEIETTLRETWDNVTTHQNMPSA